MKKKIGKSKIHKFSVDYFSWSSHPVDLYEIFSYTQLENSYTQRE